MKSFVVDAGVVLAAIFQEPLADQARHVLSGGHDLFAPDLIQGEVANGIVKKYVRGQLDELDAHLLLADTRQLALKITPCGDLAELALRLALSTKRTVYDCMYLALAGITKTVMVTADPRFVHALAHTPLAKHIAWLGDVSCVRKKKPR